MIGAGGNRKTTTRMLREFVDQTGIPFFTTQMGKGVIDVPVDYSDNERVLNREIKRLSAQL
ncbi:MAG: Thiamine pyrophosphate-requiring enzymes [uncultured Paraburkholderia sp.]|nr:MAG: Thiamine pyrophosphate-requiring enzymes [uncultured Paraburkholderia sp.]CAH2932420.1 MAG: Thiamine pyrophosphate-requiring enzymes [uncultured Paraburkholderia sp.]